MLMRPNKAETAVHGYHYQGDMAVRICKVLARPWVGVRVCHVLGQACLTFLLSPHFLRLLNEKTPYRGPIFRSGTGTLASLI